MNGASVGQVVLVCSKKAPSMDLQASLLRLEELALFAVYVKESSRALGRRLKPYEKQASELRSSVASASVPDSR